MKRWLASTIGFLFACSAFAAPLRFDPDRDVDVSLRKGAVVLTVPDGAHLKVKLTDVALKEGQHGKLMVTKPPANGKDELGDGVWRGTVSIPLKGDGLKDPVLLVVTYQPCTEGENGVCYPPTDRELTVKATEIPALGKQETKAETITAPKEIPTTSLESSDAPSASSPQSPVSKPSPKAAVPPKEGLFWALLAIFGFGILASLTPCVYPMIPITMAIIGAKGGGKARGLALSLMLVLGMAATYTLMGVLVSLPGQSSTTFGEFAQKAPFLVPLSILFALFALSLFGAFEIKLPDSIQSRLQGSGPRKGYGGAFIMGLVLGPISAPCVGPVIASVLLEIAKQGHILTGALQLFVFALGMGLLFVVVGTFSAALPRSGDWLVKLKQIMGLVVLGFAAWSIRYIVPEWSNYAMWCVVLLAGAAILGAFKAAEDLLGGFSKTLALLALALGILLGIRATESAFKLELLPRSGAIQKNTEPVTGLWMEQDYEGALAKAKTEKKMLLVDTYAEWCGECHHLDRDTWPDPQVAAWLKQNAVPVRIDTDKVRKDLKDKLEIRSYPTIILMDSDGKELRRTYGFQKPEAMLAWLKG